MKLDREKKTKIYTVLRNLYQDKTKDRFVWKKGDKKKAVDGFTIFSEALHARDPDEFDSIFEFYTLYAQTAVKEWGSWQSANRSNYLGYISSESRIKMFVFKLLAQVNTAENLDVVGTGGNDEWDF